MLPEEYQKYLHLRVNNLGNTRFQSKAETVAVHALKTLQGRGLPGHIVVISIDTDHLSQFVVRIRVAKDGSPKINIESAEQWPHALGEFWVRHAALRPRTELFDVVEGHILPFDSSRFADYVPADFLDGLAHALSPLAPRHDAPAFVFNYKAQSGDYARDLALLLTLQDKYQSVTFVPDEVVGDHKSNSILGNIVIPSNLAQESMSITPATTLMDLIWANKSNPKIVSIVFDWDTLDSEAYKGIKWRDLLPQDARPQCHICGVPIYSFMLKADVDAYQNVFLNVLNLDGRVVSRKLIVNPLGAEVQDRHPKLPPRPQTEPEAAEEATPLPEPAAEASPLPEPAAEGTQPQKPTTPKPMGHKPGDNKPKPRNGADDDSLPDVLNKSIQELVNEPKPDTRSIDPESPFVIVNKLERGHTFMSLFGHCLRRADTIVLEHSHLRERHQAYWLDRFINTILQIGDCRRFILITNPVKKKANGKDTPFEYVWRKATAKFKRRNIEHSLVQWEDCHDRVLYASSGYAAQLSYGIDFRQAPRWEDSDLDIDEEYMPCKKQLKITYIKDFDFPNFDFKGHYPNFPDLDK